LVDLLSCKVNLRNNRICKAVNVLRRINKQQAISYHAVKRKGGYNFSLFARLINYHRYSCLFWQDITTTTTSTTTTTTTTTTKMRAVSLTEKYGKGLHVALVSRISELVGEKRISPCYCTYSLFAKR